MHMHTHINIYTGIQTHSYSKNKFAFRSTMESFLDFAKYMLLMKKCMEHSSETSTSL